MRCAHRYRQRCRVGSIDDHVTKALSSDRQACAAQVPLQNDGQIVSNSPNTTPQPSPMTWMCNVITRTTRSGLSVMRGVVKLSADRFHRVTMHKCRICIVVSYIGRGICRLDLRHCDATFVSQCDSILHSFSLTSIPGNHAAQLYRSKSLEVVHETA